MRTNEERRQPSDDCPEASRLETGEFAFLTFLGCGLRRLAALWCKVNARQRAEDTILTTLTNQIEVSNSGIFAKERSVMSVVSRRPRIGYGYWVEVTYLYIQVHSRLSDSLWTPAGPRCALGGHQC